MGGAIVIVGAVAAALVIYCFTWLRSISFLYFALAFGGVIVFNIVITWIKVTRHCVDLKKKVWNDAGVLFLVLIIACAIAITWPNSGFGGGILFIMAVLGWTAMLVRKFWGD
jgi:glucan phosphoethanolaminetransferase (alkaline phosphatase superfamily)